MTSLDDQIREKLAAGDLRGLFLDVLGWDQPGIGPIDVVLDDAGFQVVPIAQKRGLHVVRDRDYA